MKKILIREKFIKGLKNVGCDDLIDYESVSLNLANIGDKITSLLSDGSKSYYLGVTCNPCQRMTGEKIEESKENHSLTHMENGYTKMHILFKTKSRDEIISLEKKYIAYNFKKLRSNDKNSGGKGVVKDCKMYYLYLVSKDA